MDEIKYHKQFVGTGYQVFLGKQPNLSCSTPDCSECREVSDRIASKESANAAIIAADESRRASDIAAAQKLKDLADQTQQIILTAATLRSQATNKVTMARVDSLNSASQLHQGTLARIEAEHQAALDTENKSYSDLIKAIDQKCNEDLALVQQGDWFTQAKKSLGLPDVPTPTPEPTAPPVYE